jgi:hypothetical protein
VKAGDIVKKGQVVGKLGYSGNAGPEFPHVHYEVIKTSYYNSHGGRPRGRELSDASLREGRIDPRVYFKENASTQLAGEQTTRHVVDAKPVVIIPKSLIRDKKRIIESAGDAGQESATPQIVHTLTDLTPKVAETKQQSVLSISSRVPAPEGAQVENNTQNPVPPSQKGMSKEEIANLGELPDVQLGPVETNIVPVSNAPITVPVLSAVMSVLPAPIHKVFAAVSSTVWGWLGYGPAVPEVIDVDSLGADGVIPGTDIKVRPDQVVFKNTVADDVKVPSNKEQQAVGDTEKKAEGATETVKVTKVVDTEVKKKLTAVAEKLNSIPDTKEYIAEQTQLLDDAIAVIKAEGAEEKVVLEEYNSANAAKYTYVVTVPAGALTPAHIQAFTKDQKVAQTLIGKLPGPSGWTAAVDVTIGIIVDPSVLTRTEVVEEQRPVSESDGEAPQTMPVQDGANDIPEATPEAAKVPAATPKDSAAERGVQAVSQILSGVYQGGKKVVNDAWNSLKNMLSGGSGSTVIPEDTHTKTPTTTLPVRNRVLQ